MENRVLEITLQYAKDLNRVSLISKMDVYAVLSISGGEQNCSQKTKTTPDHGGDANPMWRFDMKFTVEEAALRQNRLMLDIKLKCQRAFKDRVVGEVHVPIRDLLVFPAKGGAGDKKFVSYQVKKPNGKPKGQLTFSYRFIDKTAGEAATQEEACGVSMITYPAVEPSLLYPVPAPAPGGYPAPWCGYPPPPMPSPPFHGYGHPPQTGFGNPPPVMQLGPNWWIVDWRYDFRCS